MSEMIERVVRQFAAGEGWNWESLHEDEDTSFGWGRNHIRSRVRDNIAAMRKPTEAMVRAGWNEIDFDFDRKGFVPATWDGEGPDGETSEKEDVEDAWSAMIDEALKG